MAHFEWSVINPLMPNKPRGVPRVDDWRVLNGIFWCLRTGAPRAVILSRYGPTLCSSKPIHDSAVPIHPQLPHPQNVNRTDSANRLQTGAVLRKRIK